MSCHILSFWLNFIIGYLISSLILFRQETQGREEQEGQQKEEEAKGGLRLVRPGVNVDETFFTFAKVASGAIFTLHFLCNLPTHFALR
jgi:hypothetical protein